MAVFHLVVLGHGMISTMCYELGRLFLLPDVLSSDMCTPMGLQDVACSPTATEAVLQLVASGSPAAMETYHWHTTALSCLPLNCELCELVHLILASQ